MKFINTFKIFEHQSYTRLIEMKDDLLDILLELSDIGFDNKITMNDWDNVIVYHKGKDGYSAYVSKSFDLDRLKYVNWVNVEMVKDDNWELDVVEEVVLRLIEYFKLHSLYTDEDIPTDGGIFITEGEPIMKNTKDIFGNKIHKTPGTENRYEYDITFKKR